MDVREAGSYESAVAIAESLKALDGPNVNPVCHTRLYTHGRRVERSLVLLHGFTNCPAQFDELGKQFFERGWNVLIPRYPRHGYSDRMNTAIAELRSDQLIAVANRAAEAGAGLGERLVVAGLSLGAILTGHVAQTRADVERAVLIAPMFGLKPIPGPALAALTQVAFTLPNFYIWWNAKEKAGIKPPHGYPRFATHAYAALFITARRVMQDAERSKPAARSIAVITNAGEPRLDNRFTYRLIDRWRAHGAHLETFEFPTWEKLPHDLIDPISNPPEVTERSYPVVRRFVEGGTWPEPSRTPSPAPPPEQADADRSNGSLPSSKPSRPRRSRRPPKGSGSGSPQRGPNRRRR
ncbi:MAG TPA: alpha/beta fold hydrolase [Gaiellales bacterium]|nr:alpha/beta fold hydrolase [Gaiellales bacterium]